MFYNYSLLFFFFFYRKPKDLVKEVVNDVNTEILDSRRNIFDHDEFDIFHNKAVDKTKMHIGKK